MPPHVSLITLTVADVGNATAFYERLGFVKSKQASQDDVSFFRAGGVVLAIWGRQAQIEDGSAQEIWTGNGGVCVAQNVGSERDVDEMMAKANTAGARILKPASKTFWGGYNGYFADPDGHLWEVAHNPFWPLEAGGRVKLPE